MVIVNGMPKSGTHAVMAWLSKMGLKRFPGVLSPDKGSLVVYGQERLELRFLESTPDNVFIQGHVPSHINLRGFSVITVFRDPRNALTSYIRHRKRWGGIVLTVPQALEDFWGKPFIATYDSYLGWKGRSITLQYENMPPEHIGNGEDIYSPDRPAGDKWIGNTRTGAPSNWQDVWSSEDERAWQLAGGLKLLKRAGYL